VARSNRPLKGKPSLIGRRAYNHALVNPAPEGIVGGPQLKSTRPSPFPGPSRKSSSSKIPLFLMSRARLVGMRRMDNSGSRFTSSLRESDGEPHCICAERGDLFCRAVAEIPTPTRRQCREVLCWPGSLDRPRFGAARARRQMLAAATAHAGLADHPFADDGASSQSKHKFRSTSRPPPH
jgi:hypothetical protein